MLNLHPHQFGFSFHKRPSIHLWDIVSGCSRCYWRLVEKKKGGFTVPLGGAVDSWPLSVHTRLFLDNERQRGGERQTQKRNIRVQMKKREREMDCAGVCLGLKQGLTGWMMLQLVVIRSQFLHRT